MSRNLIRIVGCIVLVSLSLTVLQAQDPGSRRFRKLIRKADAWLQARYYDQALLLYKEILKRAPNNEELNYKIGIAHLENQQEEQALIYFKKLYRINRNYHPTLEFFMAEAYHYTASIDRALMHYKLMKQVLAKKTDRDTIYLAHQELLIPAFKEKLEKRIAECNFADQYMKDSLFVDVRNLGVAVNSKEIDYSPIISVNDSTLLFTSRRKGNVGGKLDPFDRHPYEDIYITYRSQGKWSAPKQLSQSINSKGNDASLGFSPDGKMLFIYRDGDLYVSNLIGDDKWGKPKPLKGKVNTKRHLETSFSISPDGQTIYFTSDRPGGYGGLDVYQTQLQADSTWGSPTNLGPNVNTKYDEDSPFIGPDGKTLYFSSNGHTTMGKHDIFESVWLGTEWSKPHNLGYPINSTGDDICFILTKDGQTAYYASDRKKGNIGRLDILTASKPTPWGLANINLELVDKKLERYAALKKEVVDVKLYQTPTLTIRGMIRDKENGRPLNDARIVLVDVETNREIRNFENLPDTIKTNYIGNIDSTGTYLLHVTRKGYLFHNELIQVPSLIRAKEEVLNMTLKKLERSQQVYVVVFFDYKSDDIKKEHEKDLEKLVSFLISNPDVSLLLNGHADQTGTDNRNQKLSEDRARKVMEYLISRDINPNRLDFKGWGEKKLIDKRDNDEGRARNRRVECELIRNEADANQK